MTDDEPMAHEMTKEEWRAFVSHGTRTGKLSTVRADGRPHVAPVGFLLDGEELVFTTGEDTGKGRNLARDGQVALCVDDERPPYGFTVLQGRVTELSTDPVPLLTWATRIAARYMGEAQATEYGARNSAPGEMVVRVSIDKVVAMTRLTD
jgi:PPOX class probable F420-dependent enzyme